MSINVLKGFKKISKSNRSKPEGSATETKKKLNFKGLRKLIPGMGNLTSQSRPQHYIENQDEHAAYLLSNLNQLRHDGLLCDVTFDNEECLPAHKIVVSYNQQLLELSKNMGETVALKMEGEVNHACEVTEQAEPAENGVEDLENGLVSHLKVDEVTIEEKTKESASEESAQDTEPSKTESENTDSASPDIAQSSDAENTDKVTQQEEKAEPKDESAEKEEEETAEELKNKEEKAKEDEISPPLESELQVNGDEKNGEKSQESDEKKSLTDEAGMTSSNPEPTAAAVTLNNPIALLINFLYTSQMDITQDNVRDLRNVASQCNMCDVTSVCDEFEKVLSAEIDCLQTEEEKRAAAAQFRYRYADPSMPVKVLQHFMTSRVAKQHTDVTVVSGSGKIRVDAHACILAASSEFFRPLIFTPDKESSNSELKVPEIDEGILEPLLGYFYSGRVGVTSQSVSDLMRASDRMQVTSLVEGGAEFLESIMNVANCIQHRSIAIDYKHDRLKKVCHKFIGANFHAVVKTPGFMTLSVGGLVDILTSDNIDLEYPLAVGELSVFNAVKKWIVHDENNRKQHLEEVMSAVRFPLIGERQLADNVTTDLMVMSNEALCKKITDVMTSKALHVSPVPVEMRGTQCVATLGGSRPVDDVTSHELGYTAVSYDNHFSIYDPETGKTHAAEISETRSLHCVAALEQFLFVVGGFDSFSCIVNDVHCFDLTTGTWHSPPHLKIKRACFSLHVVSGYLYAVGGLTPNGYTATVERLDRKNKTWELVAPLPQTRYRHAGCVVDDNIMISGGYSKNDSCFKYKPEKNEWSKMPPLNIGRDSHAMLAVNNKAYVLGGDGIDFTVEVFDKVCWSAVVPVNFINSPTLYLSGASVIGDRIYLLGGWQGENNCVSFARCYNTTTGLWDQNHVMPYPRGSSSSCTITIPKSYWKTKFPNSKPMI